MPAAACRLAIASVSGWIAGQRAPAMGPGGGGDQGRLQSSTRIPCSIVVNKPAGLLTVPLPRRGDEASVEEQLAVHLRRRGKRTPLVVHRIDRDTSGLVVFATRPDAQRRLKDQFRRHEPERVYLAVVYGHPSPASGTWRDRLVWDQAALIQKETHPRDPHGKDAISEYRVVERFRERVAHRSATQDRKTEPDQAAGPASRSYAGRRAAVYLWAGRPARRSTSPRQALHAHRLGFRHPAADQTAELRGASAVGYG